MTAGCGSLFCCLLDLKRAFTSQQWTKILRELSKVWLLYEVQSISIVWRVA